MSQTRKDRGKAVLDALNREAGEAQAQALADIAPDFADMVHEFAFGDIYSRPGLGMRERMIATISVLAAMGNASPQLEAHIQSALNTGLSREEITEVLMQVSVYAGFPATVNALTIAKRVFARQSETAQD